MLIGLASPEQVMARVSRPLPFLLLLAPHTALASDFSGVGAMIGCPVLILAVAVAGAVLAWGGRRVQAGALVLLVPVALGGLVLSADALSMLRFRGAGETAFVVAYFLLLALLVGLLVAIGRRLGAGEG